MLMSKSKMTLEMSLDWYLDISPWTTAPWTIGPNEIPPVQSDFLFSFLCVFAAHTVTNYFNVANP